MPDCRCQYRPGAVCLNLADGPDGLCMACRIDGGDGHPNRQLASPKIGDRVSIEGTVISFLSGGKEARVRLDNDTPFAPAVISAAPGSLTIKDA